MVINLISIQLPYTICPEGNSESFCRRLRWRTAWSCPLLTEAVLASRPQSQRCSQASVSGGTARGQRIPSKEQDLGTSFRLQPYGGLQEGKSPWRCLKEGNGKALKYSFFFFNVKDQCWMPDQVSEEEKNIDKYYVETKMKTGKDFIWSLRHKPKQEPVSSVEP